MEINKIIFKNIGYAKCDNGNLLKLKISELEEYHFGVIFDERYAKFSFKNATVLNIYDINKKIKIDHSKFHGIEISCGSILEFENSKVYFKTTEAAYYYNLNLDHYSGCYKHWYNNGRIRKICFYKNGLLHGSSKEYHVFNDEIEYSGDWFEGGRIGNHIFYYSNGDIKGFVQYSRLFGDIKNGYEFWFYPNERLEFYCKYKNGIKTGKHIEKNINGVTILNQEFLNLNSKIHGQMYVRYGVAVGYLNFHFGKTIGGSIFFDWCMIPIEWCMIPFDIFEIFQGSLFRFLSKFFKNYLRTETYLKIFYCQWPWYVNYSIIGGLYLLFGSLIDVEITVYFYYTSIQHM